MATKIEITTTDTHVRLHVTDDGGRDDWAEVPRYPDPGSAKYVEMIDRLDLVMYTNKIAPPDGA